MTPRLKLSLYFSIQILAMALLSAFLIFAVYSSAALISMKITLKTVSLIGIYVYTLGFVIAAFVMLIFRKNDLAFYLNQNLNTVQLLLTAFFFCLVCGLAIQLAFGNLE